MSFKTILLDGDALGLSKSNTIRELADAAKKNLLEDKSVDLLEDIGPDMRKIMNELMELYGTLCDPSPDCPWASWPPFRDAQGRRFDLSVG